MLMIVTSFHYLYLYLYLYFFFLQNCTCSVEVLDSFYDQVFRVLYAHDKSFYKSLLERREIFASKVFEQVLSKYI